MTLTRWQPFNQLWGRELGRLQQEMGKLFDSFGLERGNWPALAVSFPALNTWEDGDCFYAEAEVPGMSLEDLEIYVTGNQLTLQGERKQVDFGDKSVWHRQERGFGKFTRTVELPYDVDADKVEAKLCQGVLTLKLPKSEAARPRKITVKAE